MNSEQAMRVSRAIYQVKQMYPDGLGTWMQSELTGILQVGSNYSKGSTIDLMLIDLNNLYNAYLRRGATNE